MTTIAYEFLSNPAVTIPAGLNIGLKASRGEFVARVDGHARLSPDYFRHALEWLSADSRLAGVGGHRIGVARTRTGRSIGLALSSPYGIGNSINHYGKEHQLTDHATSGVVIGCRRPWKSTVGTNASWSTRTSTSTID